MSISLSDLNTIKFDLFRKPLNLYHYVPRSSCHKASVFSSVIAGEATRILRRCSCRTRAEYHLAFFRKKLLDRGYHIDEILRGFARANQLHGLRPLRSNSSVDTDTSRVRKHFLKVVHSSTVDYGYINAAIRRVQPLLRRGNRILLASSVQKNVFRECYGFAWR